MHWVVVFLMGLFRTKSSIILENVALRQQITILQRSVKRPKIKNSDRLFWVFLQRYWSGWRNALVLVKPATVIRWHRTGFRMYWRWKSRKLGRPETEKEIRVLVQKIAWENPTWGASRIVGELLKLGYEICESTVAKYMPKKDQSPSPTWRSFIANHMHNTCSCDFFVVPTLTFKLLYVFVVLSHDRRKIVHFNVTTNPTAAWTGQQIREAFPWDTTPKYLMRDNDSIYGDDFTKGLHALGINDVRTAVASPWQNSYCERVLGSLRRDCTNHIIPLNERHLRNILREYIEYYNETRTHLSLNKDSPEPRSVWLKKKMGIM